MDGDSKRIRFGSCERSPEKLLQDANNFKEHVERFLGEKPEYREWSVEYAGIAPVLDADHRRVLERHGIIPQDLNDLTAGLK